MSLLSVLGALLASPVAGADPADRPIPAALAAHATDGADPARAREFLASIRPSAALQQVLDQVVAEIGRSDPKLLTSSPRIAVIDLSTPVAPRLAHVRGMERVYPASVIKFVYLMAAHAWQEQGRLRIDAQLDAEIDAMIRHSSNQATRQVFARLTGTTPGAELEGNDYEVFRERRLAVKRWLETLGITDLHAVNPTYDGGGDLFGRDQQFLRDRSIAGGLPTGDGQYSNRTAMTADGTARLLALLATDRALSAKDSELVRQRMRRDVRQQPYLSHRIAGGAAKLPGTEVYSKSGTWGPIYADAGIVRHADGRQFAIAVFTDASPPYRGDAIARITERVAAHLFEQAAATEKGPS
ncbi:MAG: serine hydrolase [Candidatus Binatia bacterium]